jgi:sensor histidine kinase YesM
MAEKLNTTVISNPTKLAEKNIYNMSQSYFEKTNDAIEAKRGRNVTGYKEAYESTERLYEFLQSSINSMNTTTFLHNSQNYSLLRSSLNSLLLVSMILLFAVVIIATLWMIFMTRSITEPLIELAGAANEIARGNMQVDFPLVNTKDEVETVAKACNKMITSIRKHIKETKDNYERENKLLENELIIKNDLKEAQLKYLQAQINPHFLFNTLNAGAQLAMLEGAEKTCIFIQNMADFFRYNVRKIDSDTTLKEELDLVDSYIYILNVRFSGDIHYDKMIDERLLDIVMPSMILQPIIENSVNHGIKGMEGKGKIKVSVYSEREKVCIKIEDNGKGIDPLIASGIMSGEKMHDKTQGGFEGIGLDNVISRMKHYYNTDHVVDIGRNQCGGTQVILFVPKKGEVQYD